MLRSALVLVCVLTVGVPPALATRNGQQNGQRKTDRKKASKKAKASKKTEVDPGTAGGPVNGAALMATRRPSGAHAMAEPQARSRPSATRSAGVRERLPNPDHQSGAQRLRAKAPKTGRLKRAILAIGIVAGLGLTAFLGSQLIGNIGHGNQVNIPERQAEIRQQVDDFKQDPLGQMPKIELPEGWGQKPDGWGQGQAPTQAEVDKQFENMGFGEMPSSPSK